MLIYASCVSWDVCGGVGGGHMLAVYYLLTAATQTPSLLIHKRQQQSLNSWLNYLKASFTGSSSDQVLTSSARIHLDYDTFQHHKQQVYVNVF